MLQKLNSQFKYYKIYLFKNNSKISWTEINIHNYQKKVPIFLFCVITALYHFIILICDFLDLWRTSSQSLLLIIIYHPISVLLRVARFLVFFFRFHPSSKNLAFIFKRNILLFFKGFRWKVRTEIKKKFLS